MSEYIDGFIVISILINFFTVVVVFALKDHFDKRFDYQEVLLVSSKFIDSTPEQKIKVAEKMTIADVDFEEAARLMNARELEK